MTALRVLIVEDEFLVAAYLQELSEELGAVVTGLPRSGAEAMADVEADPPDLALLDIRLAGDVDGIELARRLRERRPRLLHAFITGSGEPATRARAAATGPLALLQKPFGRGELAGLFAEAAARLTDSPPGANRD